MQRRLLRSAIVAGVLLAFAGTAVPARAAGLADVGTSFRDSLFGEAKKCGSKITGLNLDSVKAVLGCLWGALKGAAKTALVQLARFLYDQAIGLLKSNAPKAKEALQKLVDRLGKIAPFIKNLAKPAIAALNAGSTKFVNEAAACRNKITAISLDSLKATFSCLVAALKGAGKAAVVGLAQGLFDEFISLLRTNAPKAKKKLQALADKLPFAAVKSLAGGVVAGIDTGAQKFVDEAATCRKHITGLNLDSAKNTFNCLKKAFSGAIKVAGVAIVQNLWEQFVGLIQTNCAKAADTLGSFAGKVTSIFPAAKGIVGSITGVLKQGCQGAVDKVTSLNPVK